MSSHDFVIWMLIGIIVCCQVYVFRHAFQKIKLFNSIFQTSGDFQTIRVYIPEEEIETITIEEINARIDEYSCDPSNPLTLLKRQQLEAGGESLEYAEEDEGEF